MWKTVVWACLWSVVCVGLAVTTLPHSRDRVEDGLFVALTGCLAVMEWRVLARRRPGKRQ